MKQTILILTAVVGVLFMYSCAHKPVIPVNPAVSFSKQVQPVIVANCTISGCHDGKNGDLFPLLTYSDVTEGGLVVPGNAKASDLYMALTTVGENAMPPSGQMDNDNILMIYLWIEQGAKNN
jgi:hypothetical protein